VRSYPCVAAKTPESRRAATRIPGSDGPKTARLQPRPQWLTPGVSETTRKFAPWSAIGSLALGMLGQVVYHLLRAAHASRAPWPVVVPDVLNMSGVEDVTAKSRSLLRRATVVFDLVRGEDPSGSRGDVLGGRGHPLRRSDAGDLDLDRAVSEPGGFSPDACIEQEPVPAIPARARPALRPRLYRAVTDRPARPCGLCCQAR